MSTEKRLIDANALNDVIEKIDWYHISPKGYLEKGANSQIHTPLYKAPDIYQALANAPTVDAEEVVRCKDCKHTRKKNGHEQFMYNENVCICTKEDIWGITKNEPVWDDWFCSCGERKDND